MTLDDICDYLRVGPETALQCLVEVKNLKKEKIGENIYYFIEEELLDQTL